MSDRDKREPDVHEGDVRDELAAYALGALDAQSRLAVDAALAQSPELAKEAQELEQLASLLAFAAPHVAVPTGLRARIIAEAVGVRPIGSAPSVSSSGVRPGAVAPPAAVRAEPREIGRGSSVPWLAAAAALIGVLLMGNKLSSERAARALADQTTSSLRAQVASLDSVVSTLLAPEVETVAMSATGQPPSARLFWNERQRLVVFAAYRLPPAAGGRTYQLWGIATGKSPVSLGTFNTQPNGEVRARFALPAGITIAVGAVTEEPAGGSPQPTTTPFLVGQVKATE